MLPAPAPPAAPRDRNSPTDRVLTISQNGHVSIFRPMSKHWAMTLSASTAESM
jgi:hypothetical protein